MINENALANLLLDIEFLEDEFQRNGLEHLNNAFVELRAMMSIVIHDKVQEYLAPSMRQSMYANVRSKRLQALLEKLARFGSECRDASLRERGEKRRKEADAVGRLFPDGRP